jgi:hypothetical protein
MGREGEWERGRKQQRCCASGFPLSLSPTLPFYYFPASVATVGTTQTLSSPSTSLE